MFDATLLGEICASDNVFWAGRLPPIARFKASNRLFESAHDFRQFPADHGSYSAVYLLEHDLGRHKQWPLILDEALRLLRYGQRSALFIRFRQSQFLSVFAFAAFLRRRRDFSFDLIYQDQHPGGEIVYGLHCTRESVLPALNSFEFALITNGQRFDKVQRFIDSVSRMRGIHSITWSIAICGPSGFHRAMPSEALTRVRFIDEPEQHTHKGWITQKKNLIVQTSQAENLLIAHDRYEIPADFLDKMIGFGADFSVLTPAQVDLNGRRYPDWVALSSDWTWTPSCLLEYGDYSPHLYVNGGVIISKRRVLSETPWNNLLFWNQAEDVELTRRLIEHGITPRLARNVSLLVTDSRPGYRFDFTRVPYWPGAYAVVKGGGDCETALARLPLNHIIDLRDKHMDELRSHGILADRGAWQSSKEGLLGLRSDVELFLGVKPRGSHSFYLELHFPVRANPASIKITVSDMTLSLRWKQVRGQQRAIACLDDVVLRGSHQVVLGVTVPEGLPLLGVGIRKKYSLQRVRQLLSQLFRSLS